MSKTNTFMGYTIDKQIGNIKNHGKFEGEMYYVSYFWGRVMEGAYDELLEDSDLMAEDEEPEEDIMSVMDGRESREVYVFNLDEKLKKKFPELSGDKKLLIEESDDGFVRAWTE